MKVVIEVSDQEAVFAVKVLRSLSFVKKIQAIDATAAELWEELQGAAEEVRMHRKGEIKLKTAQELLDEL